MRDKWKIPQDNFIFIFVGRLVKDKGINELIAAFSKLSKLKANISLLLVGPFENDLDPLLPETLINIKKNPNIFSVGYQNDVRPYFAIADALVFPSYREGFPNVVMQAGAMELPSIVTDINGCNEIVQNEINGILIPPKDMNALFEAMKLIVEDSVLYTKIKNVARENIEKKYNRKQIWQSLLEEYKRLES